MTTIAIQHGHTLRGAFLNTSAMEIDGPGKFDPSLYVDRGTTVVNADVIGKGTFVATHLTFGGSVGPGVTVDMRPAAATLTIDHPTEFKATVGQAPLSVGPQGIEIDLVGLAHADGYSFKNDVLKITDHGRTVDKLHLDGSFPAFKVTESHGSVHVLTGFSGAAVDPTELLHQHG